MAAATWHKGRAAAPGLAAGPLFIDRPVVASSHEQGSPQDEADILRTAIAAAIEAIEALRVEGAQDAADILELQSAMLADPVLAEGAFAAIGRGESAAAAWRGALDAEIAGYASADDEYFRARAGDIADIRDRVLAHMAGAAISALPGGAIILAADLAPSRFLSCDWSAGGGVVLTGGSPSSHVAMLARARGVPMIVGVKLDLDRLTPKGEALLDGEGRVGLDPGQEEIAAFRARMREKAAEAARWTQHAAHPARTADGQSVLVQINVAAPADLRDLDPAICDGIGLVRTEFLFDGRAGLPDEESQYAVYRQILDWAQGRPVTIRTLDAGGDKPIPGLTEAGESNPFLGRRGIRLSLAHPDIFRVQLRALARAAAAGPLKVMLPMVTLPGEIAATRALFAEVVVELRKAGIFCRLPDLGIMVEVPAAAIAIERYDAAFFSIGSNDLTQYVTAAARDIESVADLGDPAHPAVLALIERVARFGRESGRDVSLCGDAGGDPRLLPHLLAAGLRNLSMAPAMVARAKAEIAGWRPT